MSCSSSPSEAPPIPRALTKKRTLTSELPITRVPFQYKQNKLVVIVSSRPVLVFLESLSFLKLIWHRVLLVQIVLIEVVESNVSVGK